MHYIGKKKLILYMGNVPPNKKRKRVAFEDNIPIDRFHEETLRYNHIMKINSRVHVNKKQIIYLVHHYLLRCHAHVNMTAEKLHYLRLLNIIDVGLSSIQDIESDFDMHTYLLLRLEHHLLTCL